MKLKLPLPTWTFALPIVAWLLFLGKSFVYASWYSFFLAFGLIGGVITAVHHAEVVAHKVGEPFGTLILATAFSIIEVSLIVSLMLPSDVKDAAELGRDTVFAAVMIPLTGIIGVCLLFAGIRFSEQKFDRDGISAALITLSAICVLTLILPNYTTSVLRPLLA
jgi:Ca2+:H+ antiporter